MKCKSFILSYIRFIFYVSFIFPCMTMAQTLFNSNAPSVFSSSNVSFKKFHPHKTFLITPESGKGGIMGPSAPFEVEAGTSVVFKATPNQNYKVNQWIVDDAIVKVDKDTYALSNVQANHTVKVTFARENIFVIAGYRTDPIVPFLIASTDDGETWSSKPIFNLQRNGAKKINASSCTKGMINPLCIVAGQIADKPLMALSYDFANIWEVFDIENLPASGVFLNASCTGNDNRAVCAIFGDTIIDSNVHTPFIVVTKNGGHTWQLQSDLAKDIVFDAVSCTGEGSNAVCVAIGNNTTNEYTSPRFAISTDGAQTWKILSIDQARFGTFHAVSCTGSGPNTICTAVGWMDGNKAPLIAVSQNAGKNWVLENIDPQQSNFKLSKVSCTGEGSKAICGAVGNHSAEDNIIIKSTDGGDHWVIADAHSRENWAFDISCTGNNDTSVCATAGRYSPNKYDDPYGEVFWSRDSANTWNEVSEQFVGLDKIYCVGNGRNAQCVAAVEKQPRNGWPHLIVSQKKFTAWDEKTIDEFNGAVMTTITGLGGK